MTSAKFLEGIGGNLADSWIATLLTPAFAFWLGGGLAALQKFGWEKVKHELTGLTEPLQILVLIIGLLVIVTSGFVVQQFDYYILRLLEGYWPVYFNPLRVFFLREQKNQFRLVDQQLQTFIRRGIATLSLEERQAYIQADLQLSQYPARFDRLMPTRLGNILRAGEDRSTEKYGLDAIICWPRFWLILPDIARKELSEARSELNLTARVWLWSLLFGIWSILFGILWPLLLSLVSALFTYRWMLRAASIYSDLLEAAFDLYRFKLYEELHWPLPDTPADDYGSGRKLTAFLWYGSDQSEPKFKHLK